ncbi:hypothetical protein ACIBBB_00155 [Streptomyces sp. NPDC051217]|uniref:hypothetical protein n=1 Tax=Streptomyces sp. NPDC051217 TaxID=3365644 RepID=UPI00379BF688
MDGTPDPQWMVVANVVRWRRYGDGGQELRPGTKAYKGGARVFVVLDYPGMGHMEVTTIGQARNTGHWITIATATRHLHTFRPKLVHSPAVLRRAHPEGHDEECARQRATSLERLAAMYRAEVFAGAHHPEGCLCHECLNGAYGARGEDGAERPVTSG